MRYIEEYHIPQGNGYHAAFYISKGDSFDLEAGGFSVWRNGCRIGKPVGKNINKFHPKTLEEAQKFIMAQAARELRQIQEELVERTLAVKNTIEILRDSGLKTMKTKVDPLSRPLREGGA